MIIAPPSTSPTPTPAARYLFVIVNVLANVDICALADANATVTACAIAFAADLFDRFPPGVVPVCANVPDAADVPAFAADLRDRFFAGATAGAIPPAAATAADLFDVLVVVIAYAAADVFAYGADLIDRFPDVPADAHADGYVDATAAVLLDRLRLGAVYADAFATVTAGVIVQEAW